MKQSKQGDPVQSKWGSVIYTSLHPFGWHSQSCTTFGEWAWQTSNLESQGSSTIRKGGTSGTGEENMKKKRLRVILWAAYASWLLTTISNQGDLEQFVDNRDLFIRVVGEIMTEFNMQQPSSAPATHEAGSLGTEDAEGDKKWIRIFWGREHGGPDDRDQWRDHDLWRLWGRVVGCVWVFVSCCLWMLVDESKYSVAMATLRLTGLSFSLQGQAWGHPG